MPQVPSPIEGESPKVQYQEDFFVYAVKFTNVVVSGSADNNIQIEADSYFKWIKGTFFANINAANPSTTESTRPIPPLELQITDSGSGRQLFNIPVFVDTIFGEGRLPFILPIPRIFLPRSNIAFSITNASAADAWDCTLNLIGVKGFKGKARR